MTVANVSTSSLFYWDFNRGDVFTYGGHTYYVDRMPTKVFVSVTSFTDFREGRFRIADLGKRLTKADIRRATKEELEIIDGNKTKADPRIVFGAPVSITDPAKAKKYGATVDTLFFVFKEGADLMNIIEVGGGATKGRYLRFAPTELTYREVVAK